MALFRGARRMLLYTLSRGRLRALFQPGRSRVESRFGVMRIVNLAHGDFLMLGAFMAYWLFTLFAIDPVRPFRSSLPCF